MPTLRDTFKMTFTSRSGTVSYEDSMKVPSAAGDFKGLKDRGLTGSSTDIVHSALTQRLTLTITARRLTRARRGARCGRGAPSLVS